MRKGHKKTHRRHHRGHRTYRIHNPDWKILAFAGATGVVGTIAVYYLNTNVDFFKKNWYAAPLALAAGGVLLLSKMPTIGIALGALAGFLGYLGYQNSQNPSTTTSGFTDAGRMGMRSDSGMFERQAGAIMGDARAQMRAQQQAAGRIGVGAIMGPASAQQRAAQRAAGFSDAGGIPASSFD